ncbi:hypothetical protein B0H13DRAFT_1998794, partial [Mycena leptocephala]
CPMSILFWTFSSWATCTYFFVRAFLDENVGVRSVLRQSGMAGCSYSAGESHLFIYLFTPVRFFLIGILYRTFCILILVKPVHPRRSNCSPANGTNPSSVSCPAN